MANTLGWKNINFILNGHRVAGYADESPPVEMPIIEIETVVWGKDGTMMTNSTGRQGGEVKVKLLGTSTTTKFLMREWARIQRTGETVNWEGTYGDTLLNYRSLLRGGRLTMAPVTVSPEVTAEFTFVFEQIIPQFDTARFVTEPLVVGG